MEFSTKNTNFPIQITVLLTTLWTGDMIMLAWSSFQWNTLVEHAKDSLRQTIWWRCHLVRHTNLQCLRLPPLFLRHGRLVLLKDNLVQRDDEMVSYPCHHSSIVVVRNQLTIDVDDSLFWCLCLAHARELLLCTYCI